MSIGGGVVVRVVVSFCYWPSGISGLLANMTEGHLCQKDTLLLLASCQIWQKATLTPFGWCKWPSATSLLANMTEGHLSQKASIRGLVWVGHLWQKASTRTLFPWRQTPPEGHGTRQEVTSYPYPQEGHGIRQEVTSYPTCGHTNRCKNNFVGRQ